MGTKKVVDGQTAKTTRVRKRQQLSPEKPPVGTRNTVNLALSRAHIAILVEALDSHVYWQLSDPFYRRDGYVDRPGSDVSETVHEIATTNRLRSRLERTIERARAQRR